MWLTQTYLNSFRGEFPLNLYLFFNRYTDWDADEVRGLSNYLRQLGRRTRYKLAGYMPADAIDGTAIGEELDHHFAPLIHEKLGREHIYFGLFICDRPLTGLAPDGSNGRWVFLRFDKNMDGLAPLPQIIQMIEEVASNEESTDPIQDLVIKLLGSRKIGKKIFRSVSLSSGGGSLNMGNLIDALSRDKFISTNIYR